MARKDNYFVYTLSFEGIVFYVGMTKHPINRFKQHCSCSFWTTTGIILLIREQNKLPELDILFKFNDKDEATIHEFNVIRQYALSRHPLCNLAHNDPENVLHYYWNYSFVQMLPRLILPTELISTIKQKVNCNLYI